jgi:hypothetical protein
MVYKYLCEVGLGFLQWRRAWGPSSHIHPRVSTGALSHPESPRSELRIEYAEVDTPKHTPDMLSIS